MRELSLFTGAGGGVYGSKLLGFTTVGYVESNQYAQQVIKQRIEDGIFDTAPIFGDIDLFAIHYAAKYRGLVDIITGGFPCQPFSAAGKQQTFKDERNKWPSTFDVIKKVRSKWVLLENVSGLLHKHGYFGTILRDLAEAGYDVKWDCISASEIGAPHKRERLWILATDTHNKGFRRGEQFKESTTETSDNPANTNVDRERNYRGDVRACQWWKSKPALDRMVDGVANRSERLKALGNGQVPLVVATAWERLTNDDEQ